MEIDRAGYQLLTRAESLLLLASAKIGRIAITWRAMPLVVPVRFVIDDEDILFRAHDGTSLSQGTQGAVVAFEADRPSADSDVEWSVLVRGVATHLTHAQHLARTAVVPVPGWSPDRPAHTVIVSIDDICGRRVIDEPPSTQRSAPTMNVDRRWASG